MEEIKEKLKELKKEYREKIEKEVREKIEGEKKKVEEALQKYNKYNEMVDDLEYQFEQLKQLKQDVFDLELELKLSKDKIKSGNFNMVKIYLDGLTPRVQKVWDKVGKQPKKLELKLIDDSELAADLAKAKEAMARYDAGAKAAGGVGGG